MRQLFLFSDTSFLLVYEALKREREGQEKDHPSLILYLMEGLHSLRTSVMIENEIETISLLVDEEKDEEDRREDTMKMEWETKKNENEE